MWFRLCAYLVVSLATSTSATLQEQALYIDEIQSKVLSFLDQSATADYRKVSRALRRSTDVHRPEFVIMTPRTWWRKYPHLDVYRSAARLTSYLSADSQALLPGAEVSESFAQSVHAKGVLRLFVNEDSVKYLSSLLKSFLKKFRGFQLIVEDLTSVTYGFLSTFLDLHYDLVIRSFRIVPDVAGHLDCLLMNAKKIKSVKIVEKVGFDAWKQYAYKTEMVSTYFGRLCNFSEDVAKLLAERVRASHLVWIAGNFTPDLEPYLDFIFAFDCAEYSCDGELNAHALRKYDQIKGIRIRFSGKSLGEFLNNANPNISHSLLRLTAEGFSIPEGCLSKEAVNVLRNLRTFHLTESGDMDLSFLDQLKHLYELRVEGTCSVRFPSALGVDTLHISEQVTVMEPLVLTARDVTLESFHRFMQFENTEYLRIENMPDGSMKDLLVKLPATLRFLEIRIGSSDDRGLLEAAIQEEMWPNLYVCYLDFTKNE